MFHDYDHYFLQMLEKIDLSDQKETVWEKLEGLILPSYFTNKSVAKSQPSTSHESQAEQAIKSLPRLMIKEEDPLKVSTKLCQGQFIRYQHYKFSSQSA